MNRKALGSQHPTGRSEYSLMQQHQQKAMMPRLLQRYMYYSLSLSLSPLSLSSLSLLPLSPLSLSSPSLSLSPSLSPLILSLLSLSLSSLSLSLSPLSLSLSVLSPLSPSLLSPLVLSLSLSVSSLVSSALSLLLSARPSLAAGWVDGVLSESVWLAEWGTSGLYFSIFVCFLLFLFIRLVCWVLFVVWFLKIEECCVLGRGVCSHVWEHGCPRQREF